VNWVFRGPGGAGVSRSPPPRPDERQHWPSDLVERKFVAPEPNRLCGRPDLRENAHRLGLRRLHHRRVLAHRGRLAALDLAAGGSRHRRPRDGCVEPHPSCQVLDGLVHDSDRDVQYRSVRYSERLNDNDIVASVGSRRDGMTPPWPRAPTVSTSGNSSTPRAPTTALAPRRDHRGQLLPHPSRVRSHLLPSDKPPSRRLPNSPSSHGTRGDSVAGQAVHPVPAKPLCAIP
jgi:hypothetical protein